MKTYQLPNATVGRLYSCIIDASSFGLDDIEFQGDINRGFKGLVLSVEDDGAQIRVDGTPEADGNFSVNVMYASSSSSGKPEPSAIKLTVNPDPRSLWKSLEPESDEYHKLHTHSQLLTADDHSWKMAAASVRGRSHAHKAGFREDDVELYDCSTTGWKIMIVADGAGSAKFSREGSRIAVTTAVSILGEKLDSEFGLQGDELLEPGYSVSVAADNTFIKDLSTLFSKCASSVVDTIQQEALDKGCEERDYSTTFLVAAVKQSGAKSLLVSYWIGDGAIAAISDNKSTLLGQSDGGEYAGQTVFLNKKSIKNFADSSFTCTILENLQSLLVMSDGVSDPRFETDSGLESTEKWLSLWDELTPLLDKQAPDLELLTWLEFWAKGHHDDRTLALVWW